MVTTVVLALAVVQALGMAQVRGYVRLLPIERKWPFDNPSTLRRGSGQAGLRTGLRTRLRRWHRWGGIAVLVLTLAVAVICVFGIGGRYVSYSLRAQAHVAMGALAILALLLKVAITHRFRRYLRFALVLGAAAGLLILGTFVTSALWYFHHFAVQGSGGLIETFQPKDYRRDRLNRRTLAVLTIMLLVQALFGSLLAACGGAKDETAVPASAARSAGRSVGSKAYVKWALSASLSSQGYLNQFDFSIEMATPIADSRTALHQDAADDD